MNLDESSAYGFTLLALCIWRESRGEPVIAQQGVGWVVKNRVLSPRWWGNSYASCVLKPFQFSSFNPGDPNAVKWPTPGDSVWMECLTVAAGIISNTLDDPTDGATSYFDQSLDNDPPSWATDGSNTHTVNLGALRFYRLVI